MKCIKYLLKRVALIILLFTAKPVIGQNLDLEKISDIKKHKLFTPGGGITASTVYYTGNGGIGREPFSYFINGSFNLNVKGLIDLPFTFNLTNAGGAFRYPVAPNRLSLHPKYKAWTTHIGDVNMFYSSYTLNDHPFRGVGVDYAPQKGLKVSVMGGQLQRSVEYDSTNLSTLASYRRFGFGTKINLDKKLYKVGMIVFAAKDNVNSLNFKPDSLQIFPKQNIVVSFNGAYTPEKNFDITAEYSTSGITRDLRDTSAATKSSKNPLKGLIGGKNSNSFYKAFKTNLNYKILNSIIGLGFERIDPGYETLGAYYFNNDFQNITVNFARPFFKQKVQTSANMGIQRDNLDRQKVGSNKRKVMALNLSYIPNQKIFITTSYSNFTTFMNIRPFFQLINQVSQVQNFDTLNYSQVTDNANANVNYLFGKNTTRKQSVNLNVTYLNAKDRQGGKPKFGTGSKFWNLTASYSLAFVPEAISLSASFNSSFNKIVGSNSLILGPSIALRSKLFKVISASAIASYNESSINGEAEGNIMNAQLNLLYNLAKKHNFSLNVLNQLRNTKRGNFNDLVLTAGYSYFF